MPLSEEQHRVRRLEAAGIGRVYHDMTLSRIPDGHGKALKTWLLSNSRAALRQGRGLSMYSEGINSYEAAILVARGMVLLGNLVRVVSLQRLVRGASTRWDSDDDWDSEEWDGVLFVTRFHDKRLECPLTQHELFHTEELLRDIHDRGLSVFYQGTTDMKKWTRWWRKPLVDRIMEVNEDLKLGERAGR